MVQCGNLIKVGAKHEVFEARHEAPGLRSGAAQIAKASSAVQRNALDLTSCMVHYKFHDADYWDLRH